eukprot:Clim_evm115s210 gene=Clim_evmTU115s210
MSASTASPGVGSMLGIIMGELTLIAVGKGSYTVMVAPFERALAICQCGPIVMQRRQQQILSQDSNMTEDMQQDSDVDVDGSYDDSYLPAQQATIGAAKASIQGGMFRVIGFNQKANGWRAHFAGLQTSMLLSILHPTIQDTMDTLYLYGRGLVQAAEEDDEGGLVIDISSFGELWAENVFTHAITGYVLAPLKLIQTRRFILGNAATDREATLKGIYEFEDGYNGYFTAATASAVSDSIGAFFSFSNEVILSLILGLEFDGSILQWFFADSLLNLTNLAVRAPVETARRRLEIQALLCDPDSRLYRPDHVAYDGLFDCMSRMVAEEGIWSLYPALRLRIVHLFAVNVMYLLLEEA